MASRRPARRMATARTERDQGEVDKADKGAVPGRVPSGAPGPAKSDIRIFPLTTDVIGNKHRDFYTTARSLDEAAVADWPLRGPRSVRWILKFIGDPCNT